MTIKTLFGKIRSKIIRVLLGKKLFKSATNIDRKIDELDNKLNSLDKKLSNQDIKISNQDIKLSNQDIILSNQDMQLEKININIDCLDKNINILNDIVNKSNDNINYFYNIINQNMNQVVSENKIIKTFLLAKEQSPELIKKFASGLKNDEELINALAKTSIFHEIQNEFYLNSRNYSCIFFGSGYIPSNISQNNIISMSNNPIMKPQALLALINLSWNIYMDEERAMLIEQIYDPAILASESWIPLLYISFLLMRKNEDKAFSILLEYSRRHSINNIVEFLAVSDLAYRRGLVTSNDDIKAASELFQIIISNVENNVLETYINQYGNNASIAVVGNGPYELSLGKGVEIDSHDIVIRFNNYNTTDSYSKDYGEKTNIIFFGPCFSTNAPIFEKKVGFYVSYGVFSEVFSLDIIESFKKKRFTNISTLELYPMGKRIYLDYNINKPTSGFKAVYYFMKVLGRFIDIYGMCFNKGIVLENHYYEPVFANDSPWHDLNCELEAMKHILKDTNKQQ